MTSKECVLAALRNQQPEWIPTFEWLVDHRLTEALCPGGGELDFVEWANWDAVVVYADDHPDTDGKTRYVDEWGLEFQKITEEYPVAMNHRFDRIEDLDSFTIPDPTEEWHFRSLRKAIERFKGQKAIVFRLRDAYSMPRYLLGMENLMIKTVTEPKFVERVIDISIDYYIGMARAAAKIGVDVFWTSDDYCDNRGPVMGPDLWRSMFLGGLKRLLQEVKALDKPFIKHCDGNINVILNDLVDAGIDCIDPIDIGAAMDLKEVKTRFGERLAIKGAVPLTLLCEGTVDEISRSVANCIETAGPKGYILSSSSDITASVKPENYKAMLDALKRYGK